MGQIEILYILNIFFAVILACEPRFRRPGYISVDEEDYDSKESASIPVTFVYNRMKVPDTEGPPRNVIFNGAPHSGWYPDTYPHPASTGPLLSYDGLQASKREISPYTSYQTPSGQYRGMYPARIYEKVNSDRGPSFYNRPLLSPEYNMGYPNQPRISKKVDFDSRSRVYDGFQAAIPNKNKVYADNRSRLQKFRRPSSGQAKMVRPGPYAESSEWSYKKNPANEKSYPARYLLIRSIRDNSTVRERGHPALQDNLAPYDSYDDPDDYYVVDTKKRFNADYNLLL